MYFVDIVFTNLDKTIISNDEELININLNNELKELINNRETLKAYESFIKKNQYYLINPIIIDGNCSGLLILISNEKSSDLNINQNDIFIFNNIII